MQTTNSNPGSISILMVDDHAVVRAGYRSLLTSAGDLNVVGEAGTGEAGCRLYTQLQPDVVIIDLSLPGIGGLEAIRRIVARDVAARVLVFSMHEDTVFVEQALQAGARGYITKRAAPEELVAAVRQVAAGRIHLEPEIAQRLAFQKARGRASPLSALSPREFEIFCLLAQGISASDIASRLSLSYKTVANYSTQIKAKLEVGSVAELARLAIRSGLVQA
jgi:two-component system, NarL family, invasion response regulator UvrY